MFGDVIADPFQCSAEDYASPDRRANTIAAVPLCRRWLEECRASHPQCRGNETLHSIVPTRLLDIGNGGPRIRLAAEVSRKGHNIKYATLSHCWGAEPFATLTSANLESFRQQVPIEAITKTFSDAIHIARALGFCYLWIDSLCIIQDSVEDWERESSQMTQVYGDSDLTIAATSAKDGRGGCFFGRGPNRRCRVRQSSSPVLWDVYRYPYRHPLQCNSLDTRAWALQERYLSRRMLHFAHDEVFWDCDGNPASETFPYGYPLGMGGREYLGLTVQKRPLTRQKWRLIVEDYSKRDLTKSSDRFPAIAGLAKLIQEQTKDEYVAGMWREGLAYQLAWYSFTTEGMTGPYIAPSWSWATSRKIRFPQYHEHTLESSQLHIQVDSIDIQYATSNRLGEILAGKVRLRCDILCRAVVRLVSGRVTLLIGNKVIDDVDVYPGFVMHTQIGRDVHALIITHGTAASSLCTGLLLKPANRTRGEYQRLGAYRSVYFPSTSRSGDSGLCEKAMAEENLVALDRVDHFAKVSTEDGLKRYFIDLV